jgi:hypothetical protein
MATSQLESLEQLKDNYERRRGTPFPITFAKYTGETSEATREVLRQHPPQQRLINLHLQRWTPLPSG